MRDFSSFFSDCLLKQIGNNFFFFLSSYINAYVQLWKHSLPTAFLILLNIQPSWYIDMGKCKFYFSHEALKEVM